MLCMISLEIDCFTIQNMKIFAYSMTNQCCWADIATGKYKKVMCTKAGLIHTIGLYVVKIFPVWAQNIFWTTKDLRLCNQTYITSPRDTPIHAAMNLCTINNKSQSRKITIRTICSNLQIYPPLSSLIFHELPNPWPVP